MKPARRFLHLIAFLHDLSSSLCRSSDVESACILVFTMLHYLTFMTKSEILFSFGNIFELWYVYMEKMITFSLTCSVVDKCYIGFFLYILRAFTVLSLVLSFILFLDTNHFLKLPITHNVYSPDRSSRVHGLKRLTCITTRSL